ncbi:MAG: Nif11-like leader peptide family RiPP precursor [Thermodesulfobacteriota bacterium]
MKTVEEFIQRLQNDPEFEHKAQAYENSDEFMGFVKSEGYEFTLDQLLDKFKEVPEKNNQILEESPTPAKTLSDFIQRLQDDPEFEQKAKAFEQDDSFMEFVQSEGYNFTLDQLRERFKLLKLQEEKPLEPMNAEAAPLGGIPTSSEVKKQAEPTSLHREAKGQQQPGLLHLRFEGIGGGRRRGIRWRNPDSSGYRD